MNNSDFVHLHVHTEYSLLDGANRIKDLIKHTKELGMNSIAITDHGVMYGVVDFYKEATANGIKPIIGCEVYTSKRSRFDKQSGLDSDNGHLILLAKNQLGYKNLIKIVSIGFTEGFYYKPRIDMEVLERYSEGIVALSACLGGDIPAALLKNNYEEAKSLALKFKNIFEDYYLELQINGIKEQDVVNKGLIRLSRELDIPLIATNDAHYLKREDSKVHEILLCIQTGKNIDDENRMRFSGHEFYIKSPQEMHSLFKDFPEALENTVKVAKMCNVEFDFNKVYLPEFKIPENKDSFEYLKEICMNGLKDRYNDNLEQDKVDRLEYELSVISKMGYVDYFLIVWDFIKFAKDNKIMVGPGRGSAAGSLVAYSLGITNIDPIKYKLLFERFLNPERVSLPDIDIDFCFERRQEVIDYVVKKYGEDRVAQIITFGTMAARAAIRDVGRALNIPYAEVDSIAKMIPFQIGMSIDKALEINPDLNRIYNEDPRVAELINTAKSLEGMPRHSSVHAAGVVISKDPITEYVPLQRNEDSITTQFTMGILEQLGLLKMDFLGLRTLTVIRDTLELIEKIYNKKIDIERLEMDDKEVFKMLGEGKTSGVFQLESTGMKQFMRELLPTSFEDIIAGISLYRPGPMDQIPRYIKNKKNPAEIEYENELLRVILDVTYGCMVYQEQVMQIVRDLAGYSMGRSDLVRRAMSKKKISVMEEERKNFIYGIDDDKGNIIVKGAVRNGISPEVANKIFDEMMDFASYAFNKSHAAAYAVIAYQTAWLKYYYPVEFMAALLNSFLGNNDKIADYIDECKSMGIQVLPPDINESYEKFTVIDKKIRFGIAAIKNAGEGAVKSIIKNRESYGEFKSFGDFCNRISSCDVNKRCVESLIKSGAFDLLKVYRSQLIEVYEKMLEGVSKEKKRNVSGQISLFDMVNKEIQTEFFAETYPDISEFPQKILLSMEKEVLGIYVSGHPLKEFEKALISKVTHFSKDFQLNFSEVEENVDMSNLHNVKDGQIVTVGGIIAAKKTKTTKNNNIVAFITLEDFYGSIEVIVFPTIFSKYIGLLQEENIVLIKGKASLKEDEQPKVICDTVNLINEILIKKLYLRIDKGDEKLNSLLAMLKYFNGDTPVCIYDQNEKAIKSLGREFWVDLDEFLLSELSSKIGKDNIKIV